MKVNIPSCIIPGRGKSINTRIIFNLNEMNVSKAIFKIPKDCRLDVIMSSQVFSYIYTYISQRSISQVQDQEARAQCVGAYPPHFGT